MAIPFVQKETAPFGTVWKCGKTGFHFNENFRSLIRFECGFWVKQILIDMY